MPFNNKSGTYIYTMNGDEVVREPWKIDADGEGNRSITSARISEQFGIRIDMTASETVDSTSYEFLFKDLKTRNDTARGFYKVENKDIFFKAAQTDDWETITTGNFFFPLMRVFTGDLIQQVIGVGGTANIIIPDIRTPADSAALYKPLASYREVKADPDRPNVFHYLGGHYKTAVPVTLNKQGLMSHYAWTTPDGSEWVCRNYM